MEYWRPFSWPEVNIDEKECLYDTDYLLEPLSHYGRNVSKELTGLLEPTANKYLVLHEQGFIHLHLNYKKDKHTKSLLRVW